MAITVTVKTFSCLKYDCTSNLKTGFDSLKFVVKVTDVLRHGNDISVSMQRFLC